MSLINVRRERRKQGARVKRPPSLIKLLVMLALVLGLIWYLGRVF